MRQLHFAPVQGHTDAAYRHFHSLIYGNDQTYYTPFIRWEKQGLRNRDEKDLLSDLNDNTILVPQIIFRDGVELNSLINELKEKGANRIDLNMGCPFPLQTGHGRGSATILNEGIAKEVVDAVTSNPDISFSVKMRLGLKEPDEWKKLVPYLNKIELTHLTLHPRVAKQQYGGEVNYQQYEEFLNMSLNPVVYNGDIHSPEEIENILQKYPKTAGVMIARGALSRPSIFSEFLEGKEWDKDTRIAKMLDFHRLLFRHYAETLCGDSQIISKIQPFWEYAEEEIGRKSWKLIKKASNIAKYQSAVASIC